jgi:hypothetical protein
VLASRANLSHAFIATEGAGVAQSVQCLTMDWTTGRSGFDPRQGQRIFSSNLCVQTGSGAHPASCTVGTGGSLPGTKRGSGVTLITHPHLGPRSRMSRSYTSSPPSAAMACSGTLYLYSNCSALNSRTSIGGNILALAQLKSCGKQALLQSLSNCGPKDLSEEKSFKKLYQTVNEWKIHAHMSVLKLPFWFTFIIK